MSFNRCITSNWRGTTRAESEDKARSNLTYRFKKSNNLLNGSKITLPGKITVL